MVPPGGTREKSPGPGSSFACRKPKCAPAPHRAREMRPHPAQISRLKRRGLRGNMVPPSNRARPAMRCRTAFPQKCRDWPPGAFSLGPLQRPILFSAAKPPRPIWAAPRVRRPTQGAPVWGDRSLSNKRGPRCAVRSGEQKRMGGWKAPLLEGVRSAACGRKIGLGRARGAEFSALGSAFVRSAAFGRKEKLGPLRGKKWCGFAAGPIAPALRRIDQRQGWR